MLTLLPPATKLGQGYVFTGVCDSVHRGACVVRECAWQGGVCVVRGACVVGDICGRGGMCDMHPPGRYYGYGIRSMSGRYASYWYAVLLLFIFIANFFTKDTSRKGLMGCQVTKNSYLCTGCGWKNYVYVLKNAKCDACNMPVFFFNLIMEKCRSSFSFSEKGNENCKIQNQ